MKKEFKKQELLNEICDAYGYDIIYNSNSIICSDGDGEHGDIYQYSNIDSALIEWLSTLIESETEYRADDVDITWKEEIDFIKNIKENTLFNSESKNLEKALTYGNIPDSLYKKLSVFLDEQTKIVNSFIKISQDKRFNTQALNTSTPVEFICQDNELKYVKIANREFFSRLIFDGDSSEIEFDEVDIYNKDGKVEMLPLLETNKISKFELHIPTALTISNNYLRIQTNINYLELF